MGAEHNVGLLSGSAIALGVIVVSGLVFVVSLVKAIATRRRAWIVAAIATAAVCVGVTLVWVAMVLTHRHSVSLATSEGFRRVTSTDGAVALVVPAAWKDLPELHEDADLVVGNLFAEEYLLVLREAKQDFAGSLRSYAEHVTADMQEYSRSRDRQEFKAVSVGGCPALHTRFSGVVERTRIVYDLTLVETADSYCQVLFWALPSRFDAAKPKFDAALSTFEAAAGAPLAGEEQQDE